MAKERPRLGRPGEEIRNGKGDALHPLDQGRGPRHHPRALCAQPAHGRPEALGAARRQRGVRQSRRLAHLQRQLRDGDPARQEARAASAAVRRDDPHPRGPRLDHGVEQRRQAHHLRVEGRLAVRDPAQRLAPAFQRFGHAAGALCRRHQCAAGDQPLRGHRFIFGCDHDFKNRFNGEPDYFSAKGEQRGFLLQTNFVADAINLPLISAKERGAGGGHIRFSMAQGLDEQPHLAVPDRHLQEGPRAWAGRLRDHPLGRGLFADVAGGRGAAGLSVGGRHADRAAQHVVPPALQLSGTTPARYLALKHEVVSIRNAQGVPKAWISRRIGGDQIDYADETPFVRKMFCRRTRQARR